LANIWLILFAKENPFGKLIAWLLPRKPKRVFRMEVRARFKYYGNYRNHNMLTTIQISKETKHLIGTFGIKEDTYEDIIKKMYSLAVKEQLREFLLSSEDTIPINEAILRAKKEWSK